MQLLQLWRSMGIRLSMSFGFPWAFNGVGDAGCGATKMVLSVVLDGGIAINAGAGGTTAYGGGGCGSLPWQHLMVADEASIHGMASARIADWLMGYHHLPMYLWDADGIWGAMHKNTPFVT